MANNQRNKQIAAQHAANNNAIHQQNMAKLQAKQNQNFTSLQAFRQNKLSAGREWTDMQLVYKEKLATLAFKNQEITNKLFEANVPRGTGRSAARIKTIQKGKVGRELAINRRTAESAKDSLNQGIDRLYGWGGKLDTAQTAAWRGGNPVAMSSYLDPAHAEAQMGNPLISALPGVADGLMGLSKLNDPTKYDS